MGLLDYIENLQKQPERKRQKIRLAISGSFTGVIFVLWLLVFLPLDFKRSASEQVVKNEQNTTALKDTFESLSQGFDNFKNDLEVVTKSQSAATGQYIQDENAYTYSTSSADLYVQPNSGEYDTMYGDSSVNNSDTYTPPAEQSSGL